MNLVDNILFRRMEWPIWINKNWKKSNILLKNLFLASNFILPITQPDCKDKKRDVYFLQKVSFCPLETALSCEIGLV